MDIDMRRDTIWLVVLVALVLGAAFAVGAGIIYFIWV